MASDLIELEPQEVAAMMEAGSIVLVDVREPNEFMADRIPGALLFPLSTFDPLALPDPSERPIVFQCGSGMRSARAVTACADAGIDHHRHMAGGIRAWKQSGLPTVE